MPIVAQPLIVSIGHVLMQCQIVANARMAQPVSAMYVSAQHPAPTGIPVLQAHRVCRMVLAVNA